jgi:sigma-B regulation protein RsbU (phosphoserine phosphatase)
MPPTWLATHLTTLTHEMTMSKQAQAIFYPQHLPEVNGIALFAEFRPAMQVSGDYYDFVSLSANELLFTVGDISNKGLTAAFFTPLMRKVVRTALKLGKPTPKSVLDYVNADLYDEFSQATMFATGFIGLYEATSRRLRYVNAGQAPVVYRPVGGQARLLRADGPPVGIFAHSLCVEQELRLAPGDLLVVGTDGLVEVRNHANEIFGYERLLQLLDTVGSHTPASVAAAIFYKLTAFAAARKREDDQTLLVIKGV